MNKFILNEKVQDYLIENKEKSPQQIALQKSPFAEVTSSELANQIDGFQRAKTKLPTWAMHSGIYFPPKINIEQSSSEKTALIKQQLVSKDSILLDLTGGFGVDSYYFSKICKQVIYCELNRDLVNIARHNATHLGVSNIHFHQQDSIMLLSSLVDDALDYIYVDPSRRDKNQRYFMLEECQPDIVGHQKLFFQKSKTVLSKLSPLFDVSKGIAQLNFCKSIHIISVNSDCKELLFEQERNYHGPISIHCYAINAKATQKLSYIYNQEKEAKYTLSEARKYLYDPDVSVLKAGAFKIVAQQYAVYKLHQHSHLYTSDLLIHDFIGRSFEVIEVIPIAHLKKQNPYTKAHVQSKNFPMKVDEIRKKFKIKDGTQNYLFFTTDHKDQLVCIACKKVVS